MSSLAVATRRPGALVLSALLLLAAACEKDKKPQAAPPPEIPVVDVIQRDEPLGFDLVAQLRGYEDVEIRARVEGYLRSIDYQEGTDVKKGQLLFTVDDQQYRAALAEAEASLARSESNLAKSDLDVKRYTPLAAERAVSQADLDNAIASQRWGRAQVEASKAKLEQERLNLSYTRIASPIAGLAGRAERKTGDLVGKGEPTLLTTVSSIDPIRASIAIPEADYLRLARADVAVREAQAAKAPTKELRPPELILSDGSVHPYPGKVILVDRAVDPTTGTLRVDLAFPNPKRNLRPGLFGRVHAETEVAKGALLVPQRAVQELQGTYTVVVIGEGNKAETRKVKPGPKAGNLWIMQEGLKPGEKVVVEGFQRLRDGMVVAPKLVSPQPAPAPAAAPPGGAAPAGEGK
jgi:membrane fusion protein (multidrug efflux system)